LGLILAWGHLGLAISLTERDGDLVKADANVDVACACLGKLNLDTQDASSDERFPTRPTAVVLECRGFIRFRQEKIGEAIDILEDSVRQSRTVALTSSSPSPLSNGHWQIRTLGTRSCPT
jgi:hypothetical protein